MAKFSSINFGMVLGLQMSCKLTRIQGLESCILRLGNTWLVGGGIMVSNYIGFEARLKSCVTPPPPLTNDVALCYSLSTPHLPEVGTVYFPLRVIGNIRCM